MHRTATRTPETQIYPIELSKPQIAILESADVSIGTISTEVADTTQAQCLREQTHPTARYEQGDVVKDEPNCNPECGFTVETDEKTMALEALCSRTGNNCGRRTALERTPALVNDTIHKKVPRGKSIS